MFVILVTYKKSMDEVDEHLNDHVKFLENGYEKNFFLLSGRRNPRTGGVIISAIQDKALLESIIKNDPFYLQDIADYEFIEFTPNKFHPDLSHLLTT